MAVEARGLSRGQSQVARRLGAILLHLPAGLRRLRRSLAWTAEARLVRIQLPGRLRVVPVVPAQGHGARVLQRVPARGRGDRVRFLPRIRGRHVTHDRIRAVHLRRARSRRPVPAARVLLRAVVRGRRAWHWPGRCALTATCPGPRRRPRPALVMSGVTAWMRPSSFSRTGWAYALLAFVAIAALGRRAAPADFAKRRSKPLLVSQESRIGARACPCRRATSRGSGGHSCGRSA